MPRPTKRRPVASPGDCRYADITLGRAWAATAPLAIALASVLPAAFAAAPGVGRVEARLLTPVSTYVTKPGTIVEAVISTPLCQDGPSLPEGTIVQGVVGMVRKVGLGVVHETATVELDFTALHLPDGTEYQTPIRLVGVDSARERIDGRGAIHGTRATATLANRFGQRIAFLARLHPMTAIPLFLAETALFRFPDPEIEYPRGTELYLEIEFPEQLRGLSPCAPPAVLSVDEAAGLQHLVDGLPYWTFSRRQSQALDLVNLLYVSDAAALDAAFRAAGWTGSAPNCVRAGFGAIRAVVEERADGNAPMRMLLLDGEQPDGQWQKSLNTFEKRHHLRIWNRPGVWRGRGVWASAATQDVAATFSWRPFGFTHEIENDVDRERDKVVSDLLYTGCIDSVTYLRRAGGPRQPGREYRKGVYTDARVAVVVLNSCRQPRLDVLAGTHDPEPAVQVRVLRRVTLTARNHLLRDNIVWRSADALRIGVDSIRNWRAQRRDERLAQRLERGSNSLPANQLAGGTGALPAGEAGVLPASVTAR